MRRLRRRRRARSAPRLRARRADGRVAAQPTRSSPSPATSPTRASTSTRSSAAAPPSCAATALARPARARAASRCAPTAGSPPIATWSCRTPAAPASTSRCAACPTPSPPSSACDAPTKRADWLTVPNALTIVRIVLTPLFGYFWWRHSLRARHRHLRRRLGERLPRRPGRAHARPAHASSARCSIPPPTSSWCWSPFIVAAATGAVPCWLAALVIGRDVVLASGGALFAFVFRGVHGPERWRPTRIGKYATFYTVLHHRRWRCSTRITEYEPLRPFVGALGVMSRRLHHGRAASNTSRSASKRFAAVLSSRLEAPIA